MLYQQHTETPLFEYWPRVILKGAVHGTPLLGILDLTFNGLTQIKPGIDRAARIHQTWPVVRTMRITSHSAAWAVLEEHFGGCTIPLSLHLLHTTRSPSPTINSQIKIVRRTFTESSGSLPQSGRQVELQSYLTMP